jgi:septal ring-binding cell division protein DamX
VSAAEAQHQAPAGRCPRCGADVAADQDWCLTCGTAARTVIAPPPNWRAPVALLAVVVLLCGVAIAWALVALTDNDADVRAATAQPTTAAATTTVAPTTAPATVTAPTTVAPADPGAAAPIPTP